ncbi:multiple epidermal growth factor-like domains protein 10 [Saccostrea echinata]|uniref:multiple epidermal growth factor-like domains protein 10 n=1 Tax=Saccostrea echinata TaxID=191078 RepID=UPI002A8407B4|nr:multiple epidermal growth factor-like domains protein 10 [Saccostrea echinata]
MLKSEENRQKGRFAGFSLYLSNTSNKEDGQLCYKDGPQLPPLEFMTICTGHASRVIFYNERLDGMVYPEGYKLLIGTELCEVIVKGCSRGTYGKLCNMHCSKHCQENSCDIVDGTCLGCMPGWSGKFCQTSCEAGTYGPECKYRCSGHCHDSRTCNSMSGICDEGCASGWTQPMCNESCSNGRYGPNCAFNCSGHCLNGKTCNKETGHCDSGCTPGYTEDFCDKTCIHGWFGEGCKQRCSEHCGNKINCNHVDGVCRNGCRNGYFGEFCNKSCALGYFGENCSNICSQNCNEICRHTDGSCMCKAGWMGSPLCGKECPKKTFGANCIHSCSTNCANDTCDRFNGSCTEGCKEPYYGEICNQRESTYLHSEKPLIIGAVFGACAFVAMLIVLVVLLRRKGILRSWIERRRHSQTYVTSMDDSAAQRYDSHNYKGLHGFKDKGNYVTFESTSKDYANVYQDLHIPKDKGNYVNMELEST